MLNNNKKVLKSTVLVNSKITVFVQITPIAINDRTYILKRRVFQKGMEKGNLKDRKN